MQQVVVIGAGAAGLAAAFRLAESGRRVTVLEQAAHPGGRAASAASDGRVFDPTGPVFSTADRRLLGWLSAAGAADRVRALGPGGLTQIHRDRPTPLDESSRLGVARIPGVRWLDALRLVRLDRLLARYRPALDADAPERAARWDDRSLRDFATLYFGRSVAERWIGPSATAGVFQRPEEASRLLFLLRAESHRGAPLASLGGGVGAFLAEQAAGLDVRLGSRVTDVCERGDGGFEVSFASAGGAGSASADALILAVPAPAAVRIAAGVLVTAEVDFLSSVSYQPAISLALGFARRPWDVSRRILAPHADGGPVEAVSLLSGDTTSGLPAEGGVAVVLSTAAWASRQAGAADDVAAKELSGVLTRWVPGAGGEPIFTHLTRWAAAVPRFAPGHFRRLERFRRVHADRRAAGRRLYFAGDHLAGPWLEAAVSSGGRAAEELRADAAA